MDEKQISGILHPLERKVLPVISGKTDFYNLIKKSGLSEIEVMRAVQWLQNKKLVELTEDSYEIALLDENGRKYLKKGLPEKQFLNIIKTKQMSLDELKKSGLDNQEINICIGLLKKQAAIDIINAKGMSIRIKENGLKLLKKESLEDKFLKKEFPIRIDSLAPEEKFAFENLKKRKNIIKVESNKIKTVIITSLGKKVRTIKVKDAEDRLTASMLKTGGWKKKSFREYDIEAIVPKIMGGRRHFLKEAISYVKQIWLELGFKEMSGPMVQTSFWNFDALFTAQDHPARDLQDTFFIGKPKKGRLPNKGLVDQISKTHETGGTTGSSGWGYKWDSEHAKKNVLRTHTTVLSVKTIASLKEEDLPAKFFSVGKCFRNETLDWSHLFEFNQVEGIVVDPDVNFRNLIWYLKEFYKKMGYKDVRIRPGYFPYTEPSVEVDVLDPVHNKWLELGGAGIFRPEVVKPIIGKDIPVLAWGLGFARIVPMYYGIKDIRELYKNDIKQLREMKTWLK